MSKYFEAAVVGNTCLEAPYHLLTFEQPADVPEPEPGQFYLIGSRVQLDPLLKRPFSVFRRSPEGIQILFRVKGKGTGLLRDSRVGDIIDVIGPLGTPYPLPSPDILPVLIAGGIGIASLFTLAEHLGKRAYVLYGARTEKELLLPEIVREYAHELYLSTDDGSFGDKGTVFELAERFFDKYRSVEDHFQVYACGPHAMLKALSGFFKIRGIKAYASFEETMACGVGACLGCTIKTVSGYVRVCKEGPVFCLDDLVW